MAQMGWANEVVVTAIAAGKVASATITFGAIVEWAETFFAFHRIFLTVTGFREWGTPQGFRYSLMFYAFIVTR